MQTITKANLEHVLAQINRAAGYGDKQLWTKTNKGFKATIGMYTIAGAYGGHKLEQIATDGGGVREITSGFVSKRELYYQMRAFLSGMEAVEA